MKQHPNFCYSKEEGKKFNRLSNNPRYKYFRQNHFTAGDVDQFLQEWVLFNREIPESNCEKQELSVHDIFNTYCYIQDKFKKGCFVQIHQNQIKTFLPFSKQNFRNDWGDHIKIDPKFKGDVMVLMEYIFQNNSSSIKFDEKKINRDIFSWYGNNGLIRMEYPLSENDNGYNILDDMFETLARERNIPSIDFFLNKRDFPVLRKDRNESYVSFFGKTKLLSHHYETYGPILSMNSSDDHEDIAIPTWDDWRRVSYLHDGKLFGKDYFTYESTSDFDTVPWECKKNVAVWRGSSTGIGTTVHDNIRLFYNNYSLEKRVDTDGNLFLDAGITKWNLRPRKHENSPYVTTLYQEDFDFEKADFLSLKDQCAFKYILHLPGHVCAYRLSYELFSGSVILFYPSEHKLWFTDMLRPYEHFVPIEPGFDASNIENCIRWCKENDEKCREIAQNARKFAQTYLTRDGILDFLQKVLIDLDQKYYYSVSSFCYETHQIETAQKKIENYLLFYSTMSIDYIANNYWLENNVFMTFYFDHLYRNKKLEKFLEMSKKEENIVVGKKTKIDLFQHENTKWIQKNIPFHKKRDDINQILIGYYFVNRLRYNCPYFIYTHYHTFHEKSTDVFLEYAEGETLDKLIRNGNVSFENLLSIWAQLSIAIEYAQDFCGFMHMDMNPWNIVIQKKKSSFQFPKRKITVESNFTPVLIDYGNSHVSDNGYHFYNTTPFYLNSIGDIVVMVISSLDIFLSKVTIANGKPSKQLFAIMKFIQECFHEKMPNFQNIKSIKSFLKRNKNFSTLLAHNKNLKQIHPYTFVEFLIDNNMVPDLQIKKHSSYAQSPILPIHYPNSFYLYLCQLDFFQKPLFQSNSINDICILYRRLLVQFKKNLKRLQFGSVVQQEYCHYIIHDFIHRYEQKLSDLEYQLGRKIWLNHDFKHFLGFLEDYPLRETLPLSSENYCLSKTNTTINIPVLKTHVCSKLKDLCSDIPEEYFHHVDYLYLFSPNRNFFFLRNQIQKNDFA